MLPVMTLTLLLAAGPVQVEQVLPEIKSEAFILREQEGGLARSIQRLLRTEPGPAWAGWTVPVIPGDRTMCCWEGRQRDLGCCGQCRLERDNGSFFNSHQEDDGALRLEQSGLFFVMVRFDEGRVGKIRIFSERCRLDAGRRQVFWFEDVDPAESIAWLADQVDARGDDDALAAIAHHEHPDSLKQLKRFVGSHFPLDIREDAAFWLGLTGGREGYGFLEQLVETETSEQMREKVIFALSQSDVPEAVDTLIRIARKDPDADVRSEAIFWLAQEAADRAVGVIEEAIRDDPEIEVKRRAVFALSETPEGVTVLMDVARTNRNPVIRREAIFWLGQSDDPRALSFIEAILNG